MSLLDPIQLMTLMGTKPERRSHKTALEDGFQSHMRQALGTKDINELSANLGGSSMENSLMRDALHGLAAIMKQQSSSDAGTGSARSSRGQSPIGSLSATFESGTSGVNAIGHDRNGGTSYGTYQIASKPGTMKDFITFLRDKEPGWASKLKAAGPADTGSTGGRMPEVWREIAAEDPDKFGALQRDFIEATHYAPARDKILARTGVDMDTMPAAAREALWSTAVQHGAGGAARIFGRAIKAIGTEQPEHQFAQKLIDKVYDNRKSQFGSSTASVQASVKNRMNVEKEMVLAMLSGDKQSVA
ncbi:hypothetical protein SAMN04488082_104180 [Desulfomicrobium apsheronum]|uniref:Type VI secretion system spike protein VgrG3-like C-terminal domain-containing protein n=1 Tax=Desulfomicrobium apsheronum TaxID=52560 RepID=A0A1I3SMN8_9BACT|nr:hypothetical protein [Desulfomicrobium apsheronum]SFJ58657.1 hypothetical protein SAMN04488082_104180 [Desulfomicrobium apsheronum]